MGFTMKPKSAALLALSLPLALSAAPRLGLSTLSIGPVQIIPGALTAMQTVEAFNLGDGTLNLSATGSASWLTATVGAQRACTTRSGNCIPVSIAITAPPAGASTEYVRIGDPNAVDSPQDVAVTVNNIGVPGSLTIYAPPAGVGLPSDSLSPVYTSGSGVSGAVATQSGGNWLQFQPGSNGLITTTVPWVIEVSPQPGQGPGNYSGTVTITGSSAPTDNKTINVTLVVTSAPIVDLTGISTVRLTSFPGGQTGYAAVTLNNAGQGTLSVSGATATSSNNFITATVPSPNTILIAANPGSLAAGTYTGSVTISSNAVNNSLVSIPVEFVIAPAGQPLITSGGIVNAANFAQEAVSQGDIASIFGNQLAVAGTSASPSSLPLPLTLGGSQVLVNGAPAPLYYVSPGQINFQIPYSLAPGQLATVQVISNGNPGDIRSLMVNAVSPRILLVQGNYGAIVNATDGSLTLPGGSLPKSHPAKPGDTITLYAIGFGQTNPAAVEGQAASSTPPFQTVSNATVTFGGGFTGGPISATAAFAGLTPTEAGLCQINVTIPAFAPLGASVPITIAVGSVQSNVASIAVSASGN